MSKQAHTAAALVAKFAAYRAPDKETQLHHEAMRDWHLEQAAKL